MREVLFDVDLGVGIDRVFNTFSPIIGKSEHSLWLTNSMEKFSGKHFSDLPDDIFKELGKIESISIKSILNASKKSHLECSDGGKRSIIIAYEVYKEMKRHRVMELENIRPKLIEWFQNNGHYGEYMQRALDMAREEGALFKSFGHLLPYFTMNRDMANPTVIISDKAIRADPPVVLISRDFDEDILRDSIKKKLRGADICLVRFSEIEFRELLIFLHAKKMDDHYVAQCGFVRVHDGKIFFSRYTNGGGFGAVAGGGIGYVMLAKDLDNALDDTTSGKIVSKALYATSRVILENALLPAATLRRAMKRSLDGFLYNFQRGKLEYYKDSPIWDLGVVSMRALLNGIDVAEKLAKTSVVIG